MNTHAHQRTASMGGPVLVLAPASPTCACGNVTSDNAAASEHRCRDREARMRADLALWTSLRHLEVALRQQRRQIIHCRRLPVLKGVQHPDRCACTCTS